MRETLGDVLDDIEEYLDDRADADCVGDPAEYHGNQEMGLLTRLREARERVLQLLP